MMKPRLRPHVEITRQHYRGRRWHVVRDPTSNQFYRLNPIAHDFVSSLDGSRGVEHVHPGEVVSGAKDALGEEETYREVAVGAGRAHDHRKRFAVQAHFERRLDGHQVIRRRPLWIPPDVDGGDGRRMWFGRADVRGGHAARVV